MYQYPHFIIILPHATSNTRNLQRKEQSHQKKATESETEKEKRTYTHRGIPSKRKGQMSEDARCMTPNGGTSKLPQGQIQQLLQQSDKRLNYVEDTNVLNMVSARAIQPS